MITVDADQHRESFIRPPAAEQFQIFRRAGLYVGTAIVAATAGLALAIAALAREVSWLWAPAAVLVLLALVALPGVLDARTPVFVADEHGVRLRQKHNWVGLLWREISDVVVDPGGGGRDARIRITGQDGQRTYASPVGFTTTVSVAEAEVELARRRAAAAY